MCAAVFCLASGIATSDAMSSPAGAGISAADQMAGDCRIALGSRFFDRADLYFHRGVPHATKQALRASVFQRLAESVCPREHVHAEGDQVSEVMPWLRLATRCNPRDIETYLVAAFWLTSAANRTDLALDVLREAQQNNPKNHRVYLERGRILLSENQLAESKHEFDVGLAFWPGPEDPESEEAKYDLRNLLLHRAMLLEVDGKAAAAVADLRRIERLYPGSQGIAERAHVLESGEAPTTSARDVLDSLLSENARERSACHREDEHECDHFGEDRHDNEHCGEHQVKRVP